MRLLLAVLSLFWATQSFSQLTCGLGDYQDAHPIGCEHGLQGTGEDQFTFVPPPANFEPGAPRDVAISVNYTGFTTQAQTAFQYAVDIWSSLLNSSVPITINATFEPIGGSTLGFAGASAVFANFPGATQTNTFYASALANRLAGSDLNGSGVDVFCSFNSNSNWYYGTDGNTPSGQYDFVTVVLHELCHGIGFFGSADSDGTNGFIGLSGTPVIYDTFVETLNGTSILSFPNGSTTLEDALTGNNLYWDGPEALANNSGVRPRMFAPGTWNGGSSYSHLNESSYGSGSSNALMTPFIGTAEAHHDPGPIVLGILADIGWSIGGCAFTSITAGTQFPCNSSSNTYSQQLILEYDVPPANGLINVNGTFHVITGSPQTIFLNGLPADGQPVDVTAFFTLDPACTTTVQDVFTAPEPCCDTPRFTEVDTDNSEFTITNFGSCTVDLSQHVVCSNFFCSSLDLLQVEAGALNLASGASVTLSWPTWSPSPGGADLSLFTPSPDFGDPQDLLDFVQWSSAGNGYEALAVSAGIWGAGEFVTENSPYTYIGNGTQNGVAFWEGASAPCPTDFDASGFTDIADFLIFLADFGCSGTCIGDLNGDGQTGSGDLLDFLGGFNAPCP